RAHDPATIDLADRLVAEADAEDRHAPGRGLDEVEADPGFIRRARPRRQHDTHRAHAKRFRGGELVVALDGNLGAQLSQVMEQVVREAVVVIDQEKHTEIPGRMAWGDIRAPGGSLSRNLPFHQRASPLHARAWRGLEPMRSIGGRGRTYARGARDEAGHK